MHHVYINDPGTIDEADHGFLTDSTVYYNLPPPAPHSGVHGHSSSSCSASSSPSPRAMRSLRRDSDKGYINSLLHAPSSTSASAPSPGYYRRHGKTFAQATLKSLPGSSRQSEGLPPVPSGVSSHHPEAGDQSKTCISSGGGTPPFTTQSSAPQPPPESQNGNSTSVLSISSQFQSEGTPSISTSTAPSSRMTSSATSGNSSGDTSSQNPDSTSTKVLSSTNSAQPAAQRSKPQRNHLKKKLSQTRSFDLGYLYHNLVRGVSRPRRNSFSMFWRRKDKKNNVAVELPALPDDGGAGNEEEEDNMDGPSSAQGNGVGAENVGKKCGGNGNGRRLVENGCQQDADVGSVGADVGSDRYVSISGGRGVDVSKRIDKVGSKYVGNEVSVGSANGVGKRVGYCGSRVANNVCSNAAMKVCDCGKMSVKLDHRIRRKTYQTRTQAVQKGKPRNEPTTHVEGEIGEPPTGRVVPPHDSRAPPRRDEGSVEYAVILNTDSDLDDPDVTGKDTASSADDLPPPPQPRPRHPPRDHEFSTELYINTHGLRRNRCAAGSGQESNSNSTATSDTDDSIFEDEDGCLTEEEERCIYTGVTYLKEGLRLRRHSAKPRIGEGDLLEPHPSFHSATTLPLSSKEAMSFTKPNTNTTSGGTTTTTSTADGPSIAPAAEYKDTPATTTIAAPSAGGPPPICTRSNCRIFQPHLANNPIYRDPAEALAFARKYNAFDVGKDVFNPRRRHSAGPCTNGARTHGEDCRRQRALDINANLKQWRRKERWLEKRRRCQRYRGYKVSDVDIAIIHDSDMDDWAEYVKGVFQQLQQNPEFRVESRCIEELYSTSKSIETKQIYGAKLQIVIVSAGFLKNILEYRYAPLGEKLQPKRVLALMIGVSEHDITELHTPVLYSYDDWQKLFVDEGTYASIEEMKTMGTKIINECDLYKGYQDQRSASFKITPTKVKQVHQGNVYIMLQEPIDSLDKVHVNLVVKGRKSVELSAKDLRKRNPYTISFKVPEYLLNGLSILSVEVVIDKDSLGCRELKCESKMDTLSDILNSVSNPTDFMCQALNINTSSDELSQKLELDRKLAESVKKRLPAQQFPKIFEPSQNVSENILLPTWLHFSAYYGLEQLTDTLLKVPGADNALNSSDSLNPSPAKLAFEKGYAKLSRKLKEFAEQPFEETQSGRMYHSDGSAETLVMEVPYMEPPLPRTIACSPSPPPELEATSTKSLFSNVLCSSNNPCNPASYQSLVGQYDILPDPKPVAALQEKFCNSENINPEKEYLNMSGSKDNSFYDVNASSQVNHMNDEKLQGQHLLISSEVKDEKQKKKIARRRQLTNSTSLDSAVSRNPSNKNDNMMDPRKLGQSKDVGNKSKSLDSLERLGVGNEKGWSDGNETDEYEEDDSYCQIISSRNENVDSCVFTTHESAEQPTHLFKKDDRKREGQVFSQDPILPVQSGGRVPVYSHSTSCETSDVYLTSADIHLPSTEEMRDSFLLKNDVALRKKAAILPPHF